MGVLRVASQWQIHQFPNGNTINRHVCRALERHISRNRFVYRWCCADRFDGTVYPIGNFGNAPAPRRAAKTPAQDIPRHQRQFRWPKGKSHRFTHHMRVSKKRPRAFLRLAIADNHGCLQTSGLKLRPPGLLGFHNPRRIVAALVQKAQPER